MYRMSHQRNHNMLSGLILLLQLLLILDTLQHVHTMATVNKLGGLAACDLVKGENVLECRIKKGQTFDYRRVREWSAKEKGSTYGIRVFCDEGHVILPWPFKAENIVSLEIFGCLLSGFLSEMTIVQTIPNQLKKIVISNSTIEIPLSEMVYLNRNIDKVPWETDCGQMTVEHLVLRDLHYDIKISPEERDSHGYKLLRFGIGGTSSHSKRTPCVYPNLRMVDESGGRRMGHYHLRLLPDNSEFPKLEVYNMSNNNMGHVPEGLRHLHSKRFPVLKHLDFSNNALRQFEFHFPQDLHSCSIKVIDLRNNFVTTVPIPATKQLRNIGTIFVDLRHNPLRCNCRLAPFREFLHSQYLKFNDIGRRKQVAAISCNNGPLIQEKLPETRLLDVAFDKHCKR